MVKLPESIGNLKSLIRLYLYGNKISSIPESILELDSLEDLELTNNPVVKEKKNPIIEKLRERDVLIDN